MHISSHLYLLPITAVSSVVFTVATLWQMETIDTSFLQRLLTELPLTALVVWLVVKLNAQKKEAVENIVSGFLKVFEDERNAHREQVQKIIELLRNH